MKMPLADIVSVQPLSIIFWKWSAIVKGVWSIFWVDRGAKNHIEQAASCNILNFIQTDEVVVTFE